MIKVENIDVWGFEHAIRGMRNPLNSWDKSDSRWCYANNRDESKCDAVCCDDCVHRFYEIGKNDLNLMRRLYKAGSEHRKYLRQICVSMDITAPLYWWKEFDTYKVGTTVNSCSTMHKIHAKEFTLEDFSHEHLFEHNNTMGCVIYPYRADSYYGGWESHYILELIIEILNRARELYLETKDKQYWWQMIQLLPSSYNQRRTITMNYENVVNMIRQRTGHKLDEWNEFVKILKDLPYVKEIIEEY